MEKDPGFHWEDLVLLYIFKKGATYFSDIMYNVTYHPQRTARVINKLERQGLIQSEYRDYTTPEGKPIKKMRIITLTEKGLEYVKNHLLPKIKNMSINQQTNKDG